MSLPSIIIPAPTQVRPEQPAYDEHYDQRICEECGYPVEPSENIQFVTNPTWRTEFLSIQSAHDCAHWGWRVAAVLFFLAAAFGRLSFH